MTVAYRREFKVNTGIIRPFNVHGPGMLPSEHSHATAHPAASPRCSGMAAAPSPEARATPTAH